MNVLLFDMGLPMIIPSLFLMTIALIPIILIEAYIVDSSFRIGIKNSLVSVTFANLTSTFAGIPVTWIVLTALEFLFVEVFQYVTDRNVWSMFFSITLGSPWVAPGHKNEELIILGAMLFLLIPYCVASWWVELRVLRRFTYFDISPSKPKLTLSRTVAKANVATYILLAIIAIAFFSVNQLF